MKEYPVFGCRTCGDITGSTCLAPTERGACPDGDYSREVLDERSYEPGKKQDAGKARIDLIAPELLFGVAEILDFGARKYGERNWEKGMSWSRPFAACMRHMWAWWRGEKLDDETGKSHLWHAACCIMFLIAFEERSAGKDDRAKKAIDASGV